jgi:hypothetical protein
LFSSVKLGKKNYKGTSGEGFGILAGYIFGDNESNEKIAMTSPVVMEIGDTSKMMFMVPKAYSIKDLPNPNNDRILFEKQDEKIVAAIQFDGWANDDKIEKYKAILKEETYQQLIKFGSGNDGAAIYFVGNDDEHIEEFVVLAQKKENGFAVIRVLGNDMNPNHVLNMLRLLQKSNLDLEQLHPLQQLMK